MGTSSARPDDLDRFAAKSRAADHDLQALVRRLVALYNEFLSGTDWGHFDAGSLLQGFNEYIGWNQFDARWVAQIAAAFRRAGGDGRISRLPDAAIEASLRAAGLDRDRRSVTFDDPVAYGFPPSPGYTDDPVNTATGNFVTLENDLVCGGLVQDLTFGRTHNSRSERVGPFGRGWSFWATARLVPRPDGAAYVGPDGQEALFPRMGDGYGRVLGIDALAEPVASGLALCWFDGRRWEFDGAGLPVRLRRGPGTEVRLSHDRDRRLVELAHVGGKHVRLGWDADTERIVSLACSDGRRASYRYDPAGHLVEVEIDAAGGTRRYDVDDDGRVASVIDADGVVELVNAYDEDGRVLEQLSPFGRRTHLSYLPGRVTVTTDEHDGPVNTYVHDDAGRLLAIVDGDDQRLSLNYDEWGNPVAVTERNGAVTVQEWDDRARPLRRVLPTGASFTSAYDGADRIVEVAVSTGAVTRYGYTGDERTPAAIVDPEGGITRQVVHDGLVRQVVDADGVTMDFEFDADGNVVAATDAGGATARFERDAAGRLTAAVTPLGRRTAFFYDAKGLLVERHDPGGGIWRYEYTAAGRLVGVTDPTGAREEIRYGEHGSAAATVDPLGHATVNEYDRFGNVVAVVAPDGAAWAYTYDALMRLTATVDPTGARWQRDYDVNGTLVGSVDPTGTRVSASLDAFGRVVGVTDGLTSSSFELDELGRILAHRCADGTRARAEYDLCGRRTLIEDASCAITRLEYTPAGRLAREVSPSGRTVTFEHDGCGRVAARVDGAGRRWEYRYDADGALAETHLPTGEIERLAYDEAGRLTRWSAPGRGATSYARDLAGRVVAVTDREAGASRFEYDAAGHLVGAIDANGAATRYAYDERGWLTQVADPLGGKVARRYDAVGRLVEQVDQLGRSATITYDAAGRLVEQVDAAGRTTRRSYDASGRVSSFGPLGRAPITIQYDALGRAIAIDEPGSFSNRLRWDAEGRLAERSRGELAMRWTYDADGRRSAIGYPDGTETTYVHDAGGYVIAAQHPALGAIELERDAAGRLVGASADGMRALWRYEDGDLAHYEMHAGDTRRTATLNRDPRGRIVAATIDGEAHRFAYDAAGQLVSTDSPGGPRSFGYDVNGRLARETTPSGVVDYEYDAAGQLISRAGADGAVTRYDYDGAGRRVREAGPDLDRSYRWDELGRLTELRPAGAAGADAASIRVSVDALGELAAIDGTPLLWDTANPYLPLTWNGEGAVVGEGSPWALASGGAAQWLAPDWQGTIGDIARDAWGAAPGASGATAGGPRLGYRGEIEFGEETWLRNRIYQAATRSFPQPDALAPEPGTASAASPYHYAANNPVGRSDPLGLRPVSDADLQKIRDRMDRNLLERGGDVARDVLMVPVDFVVDNASVISAISATLALFPTPLTPALAMIAVGTGGIAAVKAYKKGDYVGMVIDVAASGVGVLGVLKAAHGAKALEAAKEAGKLRHARLVIDGPDVAASRARSLSRRIEAAEALEHSAKKHDRVAAALADYMVLRGHPHEEHAHEVHHEYHKPEPVHLKPFRP